MNEYTSKQIALHLATLIDFTFWQRTQHAAIWVRMCSVTNIDPKLLVIFIVLNRKYTDVIDATITSRYGYLIYSQYLIFIKRVSKGMNEVMRLRTTVGKKRLVRNILNVIANVKVPRKSISDRRKTSAMALVILESLQASPTKFQPWSRHCSSVTQSRLTSMRSLFVRQFGSSLLIQSTLHTVMTVPVSYYFN